jgi:uncharacterized caspase-like protein
MKNLIRVLIITLSCQINILAQTTYAVAVGVSDYEILDFRTGDLRFADDDADRFTAFLRSPAGGNVPSQNIIQLTNRNAGQANILLAMNLFQKATAQDRIIFYFSGHGLEKAFVPYDVRQGDYDSFLTHGEVKAKFKLSQAKTKIVIADACLSGSMRSKKLPLTVKATSKSFGDTNVAMILSSRSTQTSAETATVNGGIFTFFLIGGLNGYADTNQDKKVTIKELYKYVAPRIKKSTPNHQAPVFAGKFSDDLVLSVLD